MAEAKEERGHAVQLVRVEDQESDRGAVHIVPEALALLRGMGADLVTVAFFGAGRLGKSSRANALVALLAPVDAAAASEAKSAFAVAPGSSPVTAGIWMWSRALPLPNRRKLVVLDVEGSHRGRDTVTEALMAAAAGIASVSVLHTRGLVSNLLLEAAARLAHYAPSNPAKTDSALPASGAPIYAVAAATQSKLLFSCADVADDWEGGSTDKQRIYLRLRWAAASPAVRAAFGPGYLATTARPEAGGAGAASTELARRALWVADLADVRVHASGDRVAVLLQEAVARVVAGGSGALLPSLIAQVHAAEAEREFLAASAEWAAAWPSYFEYMAEDHQTLALTTQWVLLPPKLARACAALELPPGVCADQKARLEGLMHRDYSDTVRKWRVHEQQRLLIEQAAIEAKRAKELQLQRERAEAAQQLLAAQQAQLAAAQREAAALRAAQAQIPPPPPPLPSEGDRAPNGNVWRRNGSLLYYYT